MARRGLNGRPTDPQVRFEAAHWGLPSTRVYEIDVPGYSAPLVEMGKLLGFGVRAGGETFDVELPGEKLPTDRNPKGQECILAFAPDVTERLHIALGPTTRRSVQRRLFMRGEPTFKLGDIARRVGGRHARHAWPARDVQVLGEVIDVTYAAEKKGDGWSWYVHDFGEEGGQRPFLCVDSEGYLYLAGGSYTVPDAGITD